MKVSELMEVLSKLDGNLNVEIGLNQEYQQELDLESINVDTYYKSGEQYLLLGDL